MWPVLLGVGSNAGYFWLVITVAIRGYNAYPYSRTRNIYYEMRPLALYFGTPCGWFIGAQVFLDLDPNPYVASLLILAGLMILAMVSYWGLMLWSDRHDDDRWKKRRKKSLSKIKQVGRKLVLVPVPAPT